MLHEFTAEKMWPAMLKVMEQSAWGYPLLILIMIVQVIIPPIPAELIVIGTTKVYGVALTGLVAGTGLVIGSIMVYYFGRYLRHSFDRFFSHKLLARTIERLHAYESALLWIRILPYNPSDVISYAAGIMEIDMRKYLKITIPACYGRCYALAFIGATITDISSTLTAIGILAISAFIGYAFIYAGKRL